MPDKKQLACLRCGAVMEGPYREQFQLGKQGILGNHLSHLIAGALEVNLYACPKCGKIEFFLPNTDETEEASGKECPGCGLCVDAEYTRCPCCGAEL